MVAYCEDRSGLDDKILRFLLKILVQVPGRPLFFSSKTQDIQVAVKVDKETGNVWLHRPGYERTEFIDVEWLQGTTPDTSMEGRVSCEDPQMKSTGRQLADVHDTIWLHGRNSKVYLFKNPAVREIEGTYKNAYRIDAFRDLVRKGKVDGKTRKEKEDYLQVNELNGGDGHGPCRSCLISLCFGTLLGSLIYNHAHCSLTFSTGY